MSISRRGFIGGAAGAAMLAGCSARKPAASTGVSTAVTPRVTVPPAKVYVHDVPSIPVLAWHQVIGGHARTPAQDQIWNYNKDCAPAAAVCDVADNDETVSLAQMARLFAWLRSQGYQSVTATQYHAWVTGQKVALPARPVLLTVDDGTLNSYVSVTDLLAQHGFSMVTFIVTQFADGATTGKQPYAGWNATWEQLLALPEKQWSFAFHAGAAGHDVAFPRNPGCTYYYPSQLPSESTLAYQRRVASEITTGRDRAAAMLGSRMNDTMWAVPWNDLAQPGQPASGTDPGKWLAAWAATQFPVIFLQDPHRNGVLHERYRLEVQGTWDEATFQYYLDGNAGHGFFDGT